MVFWRKAADMKRRAAFLASQSFVVLAIQVPNNNEKSAASAEQFFSALHGIYRDDPIAQEHISFEIVATKDTIIFYVFTPLHLREFVEGQLYAQYPDVQIKQVPDYARQVNLEGMHVATTKVKLTKEDVYPIKTYTTFEVDPLASISAVMSNLEGQEQIWLQVVVRPVGDDWQNRGVSYVQAVRTGKSVRNSALSGLGKVGRLAGMVVQEVVQPGSATGSASAAVEPPKLSAPQEAALKAVESKITKLGFETIFRLSVIAETELSTQSKVLAMLASFKQYNTTNLNGFTGEGVKIDDFRSWEQYVNREFEEKGSVLNIEELASVYHFPSVSVEANAISRAGSKKGEAPMNVPFQDEVTTGDLTIIGKTDFRERQRTFGIKMDDRMRHMYIIGKSGTGKSTLSENMAIDDVRAGRGVVVVDPHGEFADKLIDAIPENRIQDVIIIDPSDREYPVAFNLLEQVGDDFKGMVASGFVGIFKKIFGNSWGPRLEYILRNTVLALIDSPDSTMLGIPRMLTEQQYRNEVVANIKDTVIRDFWVNEFAAMDNKQRNEAIAPILNKVGQFLSTSTIRNIVGQPKSTFDIRKIMDEEKILIVNLSKGKIGEDNMALIGSMIVTKVQLAAMSRANVPFSQRPPCFLYVDEFQNFATESFATILSEARKYNLGLIIAHQYMAQLIDEVKDAVIGNVGTMVLFRVGAPDAEALQKEFAPTFEVSDMLNLERGHVYVKLLVDGLSLTAFSAQTFMPVKIETSVRDRVIQYSREHYARPRAEVEDTIEETGGYKRKREAEEAAKMAAQILQGATGAGGTSGTTPPRPVASSAPVHHAVQQPSTAQPVAAFLHEIAQPVVDVPVSEPVQQVVYPGQGTDVPAAPKKPRKEKPPKILSGWVYKEASQRGGMRWYLGEPEKEFLAKKEQKERERAEKLAAKARENADGTPPQSPSPTEQTPNGSVTSTPLTTPPVEGVR